jgi:hypothetical protein
MVPYSVQSVVHQVEAWQSAAAGTATEIIVNSLQWTWSLSVKVIIPIARLLEMSHQDCSSPAVAGQVIDPLVMSHRSTEARYACIFTLQACQLGPSSKGTKVVRVVDMFEAILRSKSPKSAQRLGLCKP